MSTSLHRRLSRLEKMAGRKSGAGATVTLIEPAAGASDEQWRQFAIRKAEAEASGRTIVAIRASHPAHPIDYRCRVVIVPPKIQAIREVRPLSPEESSHAH